MLLLVVCPAVASAAAGAEAAEHVRISPGLREIDDWGEHARRQHRPAVHHTAEDADLSVDSNAFDLRDAGLDVRLPRALCGLFVERLLKSAEDARWKPNYENADEEIYLLRSDGDAAQIAVKDSVVRVDASDYWRQPEFRGLVATARDNIATVVQGIVVEPARPAERAPV